MTTVAEISEFLEWFAPARLAEEWDNVGLLVGDASQRATRVMTCLTITPASADEAIRGGANLVVAHHPLPFRPLKRLTTESTEGRLLLALIAAHVAVYSPHTAFDSAAEGINQSLAEGCGLGQIGALIPAADGELGSGRVGQPSSAIALGELAKRVKSFLGIEQTAIVGKPDALVRKVAVACGSAGDFIAPARQSGCDCLIVGEARFHDCLEAEATGVNMVLVGHYASERFAVEALARVLGREFPEVEAWASRDEADPLRWL